MGAITAAALEHRLDAVPVCHHCRAPLKRDARNQWRYWQEDRPGEDGRYPVLVKVCPECRGKYPREEDATR